ncbi:hypothetical protein E4P48_09865 [Porphyromonas levii]|nr:ABC-three component system protein [Porphyromonas levii]TFH94683.1 hypothetical protein E4P48_09865 [Porphyromonas levii]
MMKYPLHHMNEDDFEQLVVFICIHLLGEGTIPFAQGRDGGRDGKFIGKANCIPSNAKPWDGKVIIQAKHTIKENASCSDSDFNSIINKNVIPAMKKLKASNDIEYYLLFTNRKLTGDRESAIQKQIYDETGVENILMAEEKIQMLLAQYPDVVKSADLNKLLLPFVFDETDLKDVILLIHEEFKNDKYEKIKSPFVFPGLEKKNELNVLSEEYFNSVIQNSIDDFDRIRKFLQNPMNEEIANVYEDAASELNAKIALYREQYYEFEKILEACYDMIVKNHKHTLKGKKLLVRTMLHYMYCNCDLGRKA